MLRDMRTRFLGSLRSFRCYSQISESQAERWGCFSVAVRGKKGYQALVIDQLRQYVKAQQDAQQWAADSEVSSNSLVVLASKDLAPWLEDGQFMSDFLGSLQMSSNATGKATVDVLSGVTDGLRPDLVYGQPRSGLSVLYGTQNMLPRLWEQEDADASRNADRAASVSLSMAFAGNPFNSSITLPLANTVFQNGRRSTLFATRYETDSSGRAEATLIQDKTHQDIEFVTKTEPTFNLRIPLVPLTPPRKIVAGLGNIVRQVEIDGVATPASKELEVLIPQLLKMRKVQGPVGVWAVVIPPHVMESDAFSGLVPFSSHVKSAKMTEKRLVRRNKDIFRKLNHYGFRIHKILSGGGGWGAKQGLLSLDPETSYTRPDQDNLDDFIKAFKTRNSGDPSQGIVTPGSYILFCAQPELPELPEPGRSFQLNRGWYLGVTEKKEELLPEGILEKEVENDAKVIPKVIPHLFTAMSSEAQPHHMVPCRGPTIHWSSDVLEVLACISRVRGSDRIPFYSYTDTANTLNKMDRSLDEIVAENQHKRGGPRRRGGNGGGRGGGSRTRERDPYPRDGSTRDESRNMDSEWVHDKFEDSHSHNRSRNSRRRSPGPSSREDTRGAKIKVENLHYDLSQTDLEGLFGRIGPLVKIELIYDRAGRSEGLAYVTYEEYQDAKEAIREFDGANAKGQPIRLTIMPSGPRRNPFDTAELPGRSLADRITVPSGRSRSYSPGIDRSIDRRGGGRGDGRRPGQRREGGGRDAREAGERKGREGRPKKTQEELDAEMADYFGPGGTANDAPAAQSTEVQAGGDDVDMIE
ncbi:hypothetical protein AB5N19_00348 [Seiridium cardinale]